MLAAFKAKPGNFLKRHGIIFGGAPKVTFRQSQVKSRAARLEGELCIASRYVVNPGSDMERIIKALVCTQFRIY
jgi:hypothetical protein